MGEISTRDFQELRAHFGLSDPDRKLEKEVNYQEAYAEIMAERAARNSNPA